MKLALEKKPSWFKVRVPKHNDNYNKIARYHTDKGLHSVCNSAMCPNQGECWNNGVATFMLLGDRCTRNCTFCNVQTDSPQPWDVGESREIAAAVAELGLRYVVITSVTRDDLHDSGSAAFVNVTRDIRKVAPECRIELLIPDMSGDWNALAAIVSARPNVLGHNLETVPRLYPVVRQKAKYQRSLELIAMAKQLSPDLITKSGLMLGLGETNAEILSVCADLRLAGCDLLTLGQYLAPSSDHHPVARYVRPEEFVQLRTKIMSLGFRHVEAGPLVRSSYHAEHQHDSQENLERKNGLCL